MTGERSREFVSSEDLYHFLRDIPRLFGAMETSLRGYRDTHEGPGSAHRWSFVFGKLAEFADLVEANREGPAHFRHNIAVLANLSFAIRTNLNNRDFVDPTSIYPFNEHDLSLTGAEHLADFLERGGTVFNALQNLADFISNNVFEPPPIADSLREIAPEQIPAPAQFAIENSKIVLVKQLAAVDEQDAENVQFAQEELVESGDALIEQLRRSNCDPRLIESLRKVQDRLRNRSNIIQLGLANLTCRAMCTVFEGEVPDALRGMIIGHTQGVAMYVGQFPDWQRFSEKASEVELDSSDIQRVSDTAHAVISNLESNPDIADEEVPRTFKWLLQMASDPKTTSKRAVFALVRTIENLVAQSIRHGVDLIEQTVNKTKGYLSTAASVTIAGVLTVALCGALGLSPLGGKLGEGAWMKTATDLLQAQLQELGKSGR